MSDAQALATLWQGESERRLASFSSEELVAVGADSPLQGLVISERLASMGPIPLTAALSAALRGLVARGFVHLEGATATGPPARADRHLQRLLDGLGDDGLGDETGHDLSVPLSGDLAVIVALRRSPSLVCLVSEPTRRDLAVRGPLAHRRTDAILHGIPGDAGGLAGFLEERRSALGIHHFVLREVEAETRALCADLAARAEAADHDLPPGRSESALEVAAPEDPDRPSLRLLVSFEPGAPDPGHISWPAGPGTPAGEAMTADRLPGRLAELLVRAARGGNGGAARVSAS